MADYITTLDITDKILWTAPSLVEDLTLNHIQVSKILRFKDTIDVSKQYVDGLGVSIKNTYRLERNELNSFYTFWKERNGSYNKFYLPIYENYFSLLKPANGNDTVLYVKPVPFVENWIVGQYIWLQLKNGDRIVRKITNIDTQSTQYILTLDASLPYGFTPNDVGFFGRFILAHFAEDELEIRYLTKDIGEITCIFHQIITTDTENDAICAELYDIELPIGRQYYTSYYKDIEFNNNVYLAVLLKRDEITYTMDIMDDNILNITIYPTDFMKQNVFTQPLAKVIITITRLNLTNGSSKQLYVGHLTGISFSGDFAVLHLKAKDEALDFNIPKIVYQSTCNANLFDKYCKLNSSDYTVITTITSVDGTKTSLTSPDFANKPDGYFTGGYVKCNDEYRMITNHVGDTITILTPFTGDVVGDGVIAYPGCDKSATTCKNKFNNIENFQGFPYIPSKNPTIWGLK